MRAGEASAAPREAATPSAAFWLAAPNDFIVSASARASSVTTTSAAFGAMSYGAPSVGDRRRAIGDPLTEPDGHRAARASFKFHCTSL